MAQGDGDLGLGVGQPLGFLALTCVVRAAKPFLMASWWEPEKEV